MRHKQASFLFSLTMCFLYILYKGIILKKRLLDAIGFSYYFSLFFLVCQTFFFFTIVDIISMLSWYNGFILEVFLFFLLLFLPLLFDVYLDPLCSEALLEAHLLCSPKVNFNKTSGFLVNTPAKHIAMARSYIRRKLGRRKCQPDPGAIWSQFFQSIITQLLCESETLRESIIEIQAI